MEDNRKIVEHIVQGMEYYMETLALPSHMEKFSDGMCAWVKPKEGAMGPEAVYRVTLGDKTDEEIKLILQSYRDKGLPDYWCVTPLSTPNHIQDILVSLGITEAQAENSLGMALNPDEYLGGYAKAKHTDISVQKVNNITDFTIWSDIANKVLHECRLLDPIAYFPLCESGKLVCYLGYKEDSPVATAATINNNGSATLEFVATLPEYRKQGIAAAVCSAAIEQLIRERAYIITLRARKMGVSLYKALGFKVYY